jgi:type IV pilus assembly protein PilQ
MKSFIKSRGLRFLTLLAFVMLACAVAVAETGTEAADKKEVLTTLEERMLEKVSIDAIELPIQTVIRQLAEPAEVDLIISPNVTGNVTVKLTDVPLVEALSNILVAHGFGYVADKNLIRISPFDEITDRPEILVSRIYRITYADVGEVEDALKKFISKQGSLSSNVGTSNIIVTDTDSKIKAIDTFIAEIDRITPQILVEARIYDITAKDRLDLGVEWQAGRNTGGFDTSSGITTIGEDSTSGPRNPFLTGVFEGVTNKATGPTGALRLGWLNSGIDIDMVLRAEEDKINAKLLANPRILVLDNETAMIKIVSEIPYQELTETAEGGAIGTTSFREVGVELEVIPHVTRDKMIRLGLTPRFSIDTGEEVAVGSGGITSAQPVIDRREATTTLLIKDGETVVLGGLRKKDVTQVINKVPLLGDIPLVGALFRFKGEDTVNSELVVFITPRIIEIPVLSEAELKAYGVTEFSGPEPTFTKAEKKKSEK